MDILGSLVFRANRTVTSCRRRTAVRALDRYDPRIKLRYEQLCQTAPIRPAFEAERGLFLLRLLELHHPKSIVELGSGVTTIFFSAYADKHGARVTSLEQDSRWADAVGNLGLSAKIIHAPVTGTNNVLRYGSIPPGTDFLYVDGPAPTSEGKPISGDVLDYISNGNRPKLIVFDGRTETIDALLPSAKDYNFQPEFIFAFRRRDWLRALAFRRQSVFIATN